MNTPYAHSIDTGSRPPIIPAYEEPDWELLFVSYDMSKAQGSLGGGLLESLERRPEPPCLY